MSNERVPNDELKRIFNSNSVFRQQQSGVNMAVIAPKLFQHILEENDVSGYLVINKDEKERFKVEAGLCEALIVHATKLDDTSRDFLNIFIATYRTFISSYDLLEKVIYRYNYFTFESSDKNQEVSKQTFQLLEHIFEDLIQEDFSPPLIRMLDVFLKETICSTYGSIVVKAKAMHKVIMETTKNFRNSLSFHRISFHSLKSIAQSLSDFTAKELAEQMTLIDCTNVRQIKPFELLIWAEEHSKEKSPNLSDYMEHFNKLILWVQSQILKSENEERREQNFKLFLQIIQELKEIQNFNSYYALVMALDSETIRRLNWSESIKKDLNECTLFMHSADTDSKSNFKTYRKLLADMKQPGVPYLGLYLQDLSITNITKPNFLAENLINFSKRSEQYVTIEKFIQLKDSTFAFEEDSDIVEFFGNFENYLDEHTLWLVSQTIKPRSSGSIKRSNLK